MVDQERKNGKFGKSKIICQNAFIYKSCQSLQIFRFSQKKNDINAFYLTVNK